MVIRFILSVLIGGFILTPGEGTFACVPDTSVPVVALVQTGYEFREWTGTAVDAGKVANPSVSSTSVFMDADYTLQANFTPTSTTSCTLSVSSSEGGAVAAPGEGMFAYAPGARSRSEPRTSYLADCGCRLRVGSNRPGRRNRVSSFGLGLGL